MAEDYQPTIQILGFKTTYDLLPVKASPLDDDQDAQGYKLDAKGRRIMERVAVDWVSYAPAHSPLNTRNTDRVKHMQPDTAKIGDDPEGRKLAFMVNRWAQIEPAYEAWKKGHTAPVDGTPLSAWAGVSPEQIEVFRQYGIQTVEAVAGLTEGQIEKVRLPNMRELKTQAVMFLDNLGTSANAERESALRLQLASMQQQMEEMRSQLAAQADVQSEPDTDEVSILRAELDAKGVDYDKRWAAPKLRAALASAEPVAESAAA